MDTQNELHSEDRNLNVTLITDTAEENTFKLSVGTILKIFKQYWVVWLMLSVVLGGLILGFNVFRYSSNLTPVETLVSFTYSGIEKGRNPDGSDFDCMTLKSPLIISQALDELNMEQDLLENIRADITVSPMIPTDTIDRMTAYKSIYENAASGALSAAQEMLDETWYSTKFKVSFDYDNTDLSRSEAALVLNTMMDCYREYFFKEYGYNEALGNSISNLDYTEYDYAEAIDMFKDTLNKLNRYVNSLAADDTTRFRSNDTGLTFADLRSSIASVQDLDLDIISSFISVNNVTKDKDRLMAYYKYRIENITRSKKIASEKLNSIVESIDKYEKDQIIIFGNGTENTNTQYTQASAEYDKLINQKIATQEEFSTYEQQISYYNDRILALKSKTVGSTDKMKKVEDELKILNEKVTKLIDDVDNTANDYYENYSLAGAYNILAPATATAATSITFGISSSIIPIIAVEIILFFLFIGYVSISAIKEDNGKESDEKPREKSSKKKKA